MKNSFKGLLDSLGLLSTFNRNISIETWQNYIDGTVGRPLYYLYQQAFDLHFQSSKNYRALSLGSGAGNEEVDLAKNAWEVTAIDKNIRSQEIIQERIKGLPGRVNFQIGDFQQLEMFGEYDLILALYTLPFGKRAELDNIFTNICKHTKSGSVMVANFFGHNHSFVQKSIAYGISMEELNELFNKNNFEITFKLNRKFKQLDFNGNKTHWDLLEIIAIRN